MTEPISKSPDRNSRGAGWLMGIGLGFIGCVLLWTAHDQLRRASLLAASTFEFPKQQLATAQLLFLSVGVVFSVIILVAHAGGSSRRSGLLFGGALPPLGLLVFEWDRLGPAVLPTSIAHRLMWSLDNSVQSVAAVAVAALLTTLVWRSIAVRRSQPSPPTR